jgi:mannose-6-phosphate isomerase-like protein (cupin superfamily)
MIIRDIASCSHERVIDRSLLCELLHPDNVAGAGQLGCSIAHAIVPPGESTLPHILHASTELYYLLSGSGEMHIGPEHEQVHAGQLILIPPGARQYIRNTSHENLVFLCIVAPKWQAYDEILVS